MHPAAGTVCYPWTMAFAETLTGVNLAVTAVRGRFTIPQQFSAASFRVSLPAWTAGGITIYLRFGFQDADADVATEGIDFATLAAVNASSLRSMNWRPTVIIPHPLGASPGFIPPRVSVLVDGSNPTTLDYVITYAGVALF